MPPKAPGPPPPPDVKAIKTGNLPTQGKGRDDLLKSIQKGTGLKKVPEGEKKEPPPLNPKMEGKTGGIVQQGGKTTTKNAPPKPTEKPGFVPTGNTMLDEMQKKRLGKKEEPKVEEKKSAPPVNRNPPVVKKEPPPIIPVKSDPPPVVTKTVDHTVKKDAPVIPNRRDAPRPPPRTSTGTTTTTTVEKKTEPVVTNLVKPDHVKKEVAPPVVPRRDAPGVPPRRDPPKPGEKKSDPVVVHQEKKPDPPKPVIEKKDPPKPVPEKKPEPHKPVITNPKPTIEKKPEVPEVQPEVKRENKRPPPPKVVRVDTPPVITEPVVTNGDFASEGRFKFSTNIPSCPAFKNATKTYKGPTSELMLPKLQSEVSQSPNRKAPPPPTKK
jgi:hypothetical protein